MKTWIYAMVVLGLAGSAFGQEKDSEDWNNKTQEPALVGIAWARGLDGPRDFRAAELVRGSRPPRTSRAFLSG